MDEKSIQSFREKLEAEYEWPAWYTFKFIVPKGKETDVRAILPPSHSVTAKQSSKGNYVSLTSKVKAESSNQVIEVYIEAHKVEGLIAL